MYKRQGVDYIEIDKMYVGLVTDDSGVNTRHTLAPLALKKWNNKVTYHERLKSSYYILKDYWTGGAEK